MPRIPDVEISRLKQAVSLIRLAEARGVALKGEGHNLIGLCPFHDDREPSLVVDPQKNLWHCLGACQAGGSNIDWVMRDHGVGFRVAVEVLAGMVDGAAYPSRPAGYERGTMKHTSARRLPNPLNPDADGEVLLGQVADFYHRTLIDNPLATATVALDYLRGRKIGDAATIRHFRLGYADRSLGLRIPDKARREGAQLRLRMNRLGLVRASGHELMSGAVVVPIVDETQAVVGMYGRMTADNLRPGTIYHRYLPGGHRAAWNAAGAAAAAADAEGALILGEAIIDGLTFWSHGRRNVTAAYGVNGFTEHHRRLIAGASVKTVFLAYDNDEAGNTAAGTLADELIALGKSVYRVEFPARTKDANGLACASDDPAAALGSVLREAAFMGGAVRVTVPALPPPPPPVSSAPAREEPPAAKSEMLEPAEVSAASPVVEPSPAALPVPEPLPIPPVAAAHFPLAALPSAPLVEAVPEAVSLRPAVEPADSAPAAPAPGKLLPDGEDFRAVLGPRRYRLRGLLKNAEAATLRIGLRLLVSGKDGDAFHQDTIDLCQAKQRSAFVAAAAEATASDPEAIKADLGKLLDWSESAWETHRRAASAPATKRPAMDAAAEATARAFLRTPDLLGRIAADFDACGIVGDAAPKVVSYLCAISRKLDHPLAVLTMAPSASGKTSLQDGTLAFVPEEDRLCLSALTGQALHYIEEDLSHRVLAIAEEEGASRAAYSLKLLQSEGKISLAVPIKDAESGQIATKIKEVRGPVALFLTTTAPQIDEELANRCIVLTVDESAEQTARVHAAQRERETLDGLVQSRRAHAIRAVHQDAQRLLEPVAIVNPFARLLTFRADRPRTRRDHLKYLGLIRAIAFLHQHQRPRHTVPVEGRSVTYIEVTLEDIAAANRLAAAVLGRSLDELAPQTRTLLLRLDALVRERAQAQARSRESIRFTRREVREFCGWSADQVDIHLARLERLEYVLSHHGGQGSRYVYSLAYDGQGKDGKPFLMGLVDVATLAQDLIQPTERATTVPTSEGSTPDFRPTSDPVPRAFRGGSEGALLNGSAGESQVIRADDLITAPQGHKGGVSASPSHRSPSHHTRSAKANGSNGHATPFTADLPTVAVLTGEA